jgi:hypothetical protein
MFWAPTFNAIQNLNVSLLLTLGLALAWRWRDAAGRFAVVLAFVVSLKLLLVPMLLWPLARGRVAVTTVTAALAGLFLLVPWALIGFAGLVEYPELLDRVTARWQDHSYSLAAVLHGLGVHGVAAGAVTALIGGAMILGGIYFGRRGEDLRTLTLLIAASLALTPIVWQHYLLLLVVPLGIARPKLSAAWLAPVVLWASPLTDDNGSLAQTGLVVAIAGALVAVAAGLKLPSGLRVDPRFPWATDKIQ